MIIAFAVAALVALAAPAVASTNVGDATVGDGTGIGGTNISDLKEQIKRDRLSCATGDVGPGGLLVVAGALGVAGVWARRRAA